VSGHLGSLVLRISTKVGLGVMGAVFHSWFQEVIAPRRVSVEGS
jgi:hypothetical protein